MAYEEDELEEMLENISGDDDIIGEDESDEEIGARFRRRLTRGRGRGRGPKRAKMFVSSENIGRLAPIGIGVPTSIADGASFLFQGTVERPAHIRRLLITSDNPVQELAITTLKMGDVDQLLTGEVPATLYDSNAQQGFADNFTPLRQNATVSLTIRNDNGAAAAHNVAVGGKAAVNR